MDKPESVNSPHGFRLRDHKIFLMVVFSIALSLALVTVALKIYYLTGAAQLDLSRPEYEVVRGNINKDIPDDFAASGPMDAAAYADFDAKYDKQVSSLQTLDVYGSQSLSDEALGLPPITGSN